MRFRLLGPVVMDSGARTVSLGGKVPRTLLAVLLLARGHGVADDDLVDALWGDDPPRRAADVLKSHLSRLRSALRRATDVAEPPQVERVSGGYRMAVDPSTVDAHCFRDLCAAALGSGTPLGRRDDLLREGLGLWHGTPLTGTRDSLWKLSEVAAFNSLRLMALEARMDAKLALGRHEDVVAELEAITIREPLHEPFHAQLMTALYRSRRQIDALGVYHRVRGLLADEYGVEPDQDLQILQRRILASDGSLR